MIMRNLKYFRNHSKRNLIQSFQSHYSQTTKCSIIIIVIIIIDNNYYLIPCVFCVSFASWLVECSPVWHWLDATFQDWCSPTLLVSPRGLTSPNVSSRLPSRLAGKLILTGPIKNAWVVKPDLWGPSTRAIDCEVIKARMRRTSKEGREPGRKLRRLYWDQANLLTSNQCMLEAWGGGWDLPRPADVWKQSTAACTEHVNCCFLCLTSSVALQTLTQACVDLQWWA